MTGSEKDPFERLGHMAIPEPDPARIAAVASMSASAFGENVGQRPARSRKTGWLADLFSGTGWLMPASATAGALMVGIILVPMALDRPDLDGGAPQTMQEAPPSSMADVAPPASETMLGRGPATSMGAMPQPSPQQLPLDLREDAAATAYDFDGVEIVARSVPEQFSLYLVTDGLERVFDTRAKEPSEDIVLTDAVIVDREDGERALFVRSGFDGESQQWDAFIDSGTGFTLSGALSNIVYDADDRSELLARLEAAQQE